MEILLKLFLTFLKIGLVSIGGGYAVIPSIHEEVVVKAGWIGEKVFADIITISQMILIRITMADNNRETFHKDSITTIIISIFNFF